MRGQGHAVVIRLWVPAALRIAVSELLHDPALLDRKHATEGRIGGKRLAPPTGARHRAIGQRQDCPEVLAVLRRHMLADAAWIAVPRIGILLRRLVTVTVMVHGDTVTPRPDMVTVSGIAVAGTGIVTAMLVEATNRLDAALPRRRVMVGGIIGRWHLPNAQAVGMVHTIRGIADDGNGVAVPVGKN